MTQRLKITITICLLILLELTLLSLPLQTVSADPAPQMPPMKGMTVNAWSAEAYNSTDFDQSITNLANLNTTWVTLTVFWFMDTPSDNMIRQRLELYSASDSSLLHAIEKAHQLNMKVVLKPMVDVADGSWRGTIAPTDWTLWFQNYREFINYYANLSQINNVEMFTVGTELRSSQSRTTEWRNVITEVRTRFFGNITYAANWDSYGTSSIGFWDALDYVGVDAYFPLTESYSPSVAQLKNAWSSCARSGYIGRNWTNEIYTTYLQTGKQVIFTEIGYTSQDGTNREPYNWNPSGILDLQEQADCYKAAIESFAGRNWFLGWFWWTWETNPNAGGPTDKDYTPQNKPAQDILNQSYHDPPDVPDIAVTDLTCASIVSEGHSSSMNVSVTNQGAHQEVFNLTVYANSTLIHAETIALDPALNQMITLVWDTTGFLKGKYVLDATVSVLPFETDVADNSMQVTVTLTLPGDINGDLNVDIFDAVLLAGSFLKTVGNPQYNPNADINSDGIVDIFDAISLANNFGKSVP